MSHHPTLYRTSGFGCWATCACGWKSRTFVGVEGAHLAFGEHLVATTDPARRPQAHWLGDADGGDLARGHRHPDKKDPARCAPSGAKAEPLYRKASK